MTNSNRAPKTPLGLAGNTGKPSKDGGWQQMANPDLTAGNDADDRVHQQEENFSPAQMLREDPDELVHRMNTFKPGPSLTTDPDDEIHKNLLEEEPEDLR